VYKMEYAANPRTLPTRRTLVAPFVALLIGAAAAVGGYALIDNQDTVQAPGKVVFVDTPGPGAGVRGIDDMASAAVLDSTPGGGQGVRGINDMANAEALNSTPPKVVVPYLSHGYGVQMGTVSTTDEAATAAAVGSRGGQDDGSVANRTDPHGPAALLHTH
jgi:uncharacterized protein YunC (DUF1805 family)